jgi:hypothetical protein
MMNKNYLLPPGLPQISCPGLPRGYTPELYNQKCSAVFEHVYESYPERNAGVYV